MTAARTVATVDIGTNTLLLLVVRRNQDGGTEVLADEVRFGRLGKSLDASGNLAEESVARSLEAVRDYRALIDKCAVDEVRCVGTQALREAANANVFVAPAEEILGAKIETIAGEREAELVYRAVAEQFPDLGSVVIADVGGGSTEVIVAEDGAVVRWKSLRIGSVRVTERHLRDDPPTAEQTKAALADIDQHLGTFDFPTGVALIGTAGTATTLAALDLKLREYSRASVHGHALPMAGFERLLVKLLELTVAERKRLPGLEPERADVIAGGALIFSRLIAKLQAPSFTVADCGVRWGLAYEALAEA